MSATDHHAGITQLLLTPEQAAHALGIGRTRLYQLIAAGQLASVKLGASRRISRRALEQYVADLTGADEQTVGGSRQHETPTSQPRRPTRRLGTDIVALALPFDD